jgi:hypothetical protein
MIRIAANLEGGPGFDTVRDLNPSYHSMRSAELADKPARLTERQASFYRNLITLAQALGSDIIPVEFELAGRGRVFLDRGCIKIAEHAGFIRPLRDGASGYLEFIELGFDAAGKRSAV